MGFLPNVRLKNRFDYTSRLECDAGECGRYRSSTVHRVAPTLKAVGTAALGPSAGWEEGLPPHSAKDEMSSTDWLYLLSGRLGSAPFLTCPICSTMRCYPRGPRELNSMASQANIISEPLPREMQQHTYSIMYEVE